MLRDRDSPVTKEGIVMRVYGYDHPLDKYICDVEYASEAIYKSDVPKALRDGGGQRYYKFYEDEGLRFVLSKYPQYTFYVPQLKKRVVAVGEDQVAEVRRPQEGLARLLNKGDSMARASLEVLEEVLSASRLRIDDFGVFGSLLHDFYRAELSDLDFVVYGIGELAELRRALSELYQSGSLANEFDVVDESRFAKWRFKKYTAKEYVWHQRRKMIYGVLNSKSLKRTVKFEFEPVLKWDEIVNEYEDIVDIETLGFVEALVRVVDDRYAPFMPSKYGVELVEVKSKPPIKVEPTRVVSYVEEFRMQLFKDEVGFVAGWLEEVYTRSSSFQQIVLTRREGYYEQALKLVKLT
jgi:predicted nucleotidyltransferase